MEELNKETQQQEKPKQKTGKKKERTDAELLKTLETETAEERNARNEKEMREQETEHQKKRAREAIRAINDTIKSKDPENSEEIIRINEILIKALDNIIDPKPQKLEQTQQPQENKLQKPAFLTEPEAWNGKTYGNAIYIAGVKMQLNQHQLKQCREYEEKIKQSQTANPYSQDIKEVKAEQAHQEQRQQQGQKYSQNHDNSFTR